MPKQKIRYAVVGLGWISQAAVLPAFAHAGENSELTALISSDRKKLRELGAKYRVKELYTYDEYEECLTSGNIDAVYIALPNNQHRDFTVRAARNGVHVLCEKPMAVTEEECEDMIGAASYDDVKLMIAYRLHFEEANLRAVELAQSGKLGDIRVFNSVFTQPLKKGNIRLKAGLGGGPLYDMGVYCINAARYLFRDEPREVTAFLSHGSDARFKEVEETATAILRFPGDRLANFTCGFSAAPISFYEVAGEKGRLRLDPAYGFDEELVHHLTIGEKTKVKRFKKRDHFAPELIYFSDCILSDREPEPSGVEGLADIRVIRAIFQSAESGRAVKVAKLEKREWPGLDLERRLPAVKEPKLVNAVPPAAA